MALLETIAEAPFGLESPPRLLTQSGGAWTPGCSVTYRFRAL